MWEIKKEFVGKHDKIFMLEHAGGINERDAA
jgi:hypothetical protein